ncbi:hypothetical protein NMG29_22845 [Streptomyces cocklensis]|uniref:Uncharacterized protein n=1 Tax=Actinacidiphila cocklensis TaxID=887465 RepID=A0A9W4E1D8_9ACTN|nr:hypothetical protein [Actinacidiphila cocklensis]MDD1061022.1 hypothetical protein [Actinacidiphila cocklensis]WSX77345.1 hypothetical protein OH826_27955 [Streptomyces sp. NBC_00899]CAG6391475.1 conserved hypothetical protein [Actinacidiphila cocklensis]
MSRSERKARRLLVGDDTYLWSVGHSHQLPEGGGYLDCTESVVLRRYGARGRLVVVFASGPGRYVPDGILQSGAVGTDEGFLNLYEPGTARALLDEALAQGWDPDDPPALTLDGWTLLPTIRSRRMP